MSDNQYKLFLAGVFKLAKTISIKSEYSARQVNTAVEQKTRTTVDYSNPSSWKDYLNRAGLYHSTDTPMAVISLDTMEPVDFTKDALALHPATLTGYRVGTRYYKELVERFPEQRTLIHGILYPVDLQTVLEAEDFSIVAYDRDLVEENEEDLINDLERWIKLFARRWLIKGFQITHSLYAASFFGVLSSLLPLVILELRAKATHTRQVHSFHVRSFLASHGGLDVFMPELTLKQQLWLYRNIRYIRQHAGRNEIFTWLTENLLTERGIPLMSYELRHDTSGITQSEPVPEVKFIQKSENDLKEPDPDLINHREIISKIALIAAGNQEFDTTNPDAIPSIGYGKQDSFLTKILETDSIENTEGSLITTVDVAMSHWAYAAGLGRFGVFVRFNHPLTGEEIALSVTDAYYLFHFAFTSSLGVPIDKVPPLIAFDAPVWPTPSLASLRSIVSTQDTEEELLTLFHSLAVPPANYINLDQFKAGYTRVETARFQHKSVIAAAAQSTLTKMGFNNLYSALYKDRLITTADTGKPIDSYFEEKSIKMGTLSASIWKDVYNTIFSQVTGLELGNIEDQSAIQRAMVSIMKKLSSYSIMFIDPKVSGQTVGFEWAYPIIEETDSVGVNVYDVILASTTVEITSESNLFTHEIPLAQTTIGLTYHYDEEPVEIDTSLSVTPVVDDSEDTFVVNTRSVLFTPYNDSDEPERGFVPGMSETIALGDGVRDIPNLYSYLCEPRPLEPGPVDPSDLIVTNYVPMDMAAPARETVLRDFKPLTIPSRLRYFDNESVAIELNGFWPAWGTADLGQLKYFGGRFKINSFKFTPLVNRPIEVFKPNIGAMKLNVIGPYINENLVIDLGALRPVTGWMEFGFTKPPIPGAIDLVFHEFSSPIDLGFEAFNYVISLGFNQFNSEIDIGSFVSFTRPVQMHFNYLGSSVQLPTFVSVTNASASIGFRPARGAIQMLPWKLPIPMVDLGKLYPLIPIALDAFYKPIEPIDIPESYKLDDPLW